MTESKVAEFQRALAKEIRARERRRTLRLFVGFVVLSLILLGVLFHSRYQDHRLREMLRDQCVARNEILDLQRQLYTTMAVLDAQDEGKQRAWMKILTDLPGNRNCEDFVR